MVPGEVPGKPGLDNRPSLYLGAVRTPSALSQGSQERLGALFIEHLLYAGCQRKRYYPLFAEIWRLREARPQPGVFGLRTLTHI